jgi:adenylate kinase family enzyme
MNIIYFSGLPFSGRRSTTELYNYSDKQKKFGCIVTSDLFLQNSSSSNEAIENPEINVSMKDKVEKAIELGEFVPCRLVIPDLSNEIIHFEQDLKVFNIIIDSPKTEEQTEAIQALFPEANFHMVYFNITEAEAIERNDKIHKYTYSIMNDKCQRYELYTLPVVDKFRKNRSFFEVDGSLPQNEISMQVNAFIQSITSTNF